VIKEIKKPSVAKVVLFLTIFFLVILNILLFKKRIVSLEKTYSGKELEFPPIKDFSTIIFSFNCKLFKKSILSFSNSLKEQQGSTFGSVNKSNFSYKKKKKRNYQILGIFVIDGRKFYVIKERGKIKLMDFKESDIDDSKYEKGF